MHARHRLFGDAPTRSHDLISSSSSARTCSSRFAIASRVRLALLLQLQLDARSTMSWQSARVARRPQPLAEPARIAASCDDAATSAMANSRTARHGVARFGSRAGPNGRLTRCGNGEASVAAPLRRGTAPTRLDGPRPRTPSQGDGRAARPRPARAGPGKGSPHASAARQDDAGDAAAPAVPVALRATTLPAARHEIARQALELGVLRRRAPPGRGTRGARGGRRRRGRRPPAHGCASRPRVTPTVPPLDARQRALSRPPVRRGAARARAGGRGGGRATSPSIARTWPSSASRRASGWTTCSP